MKHTHLPALAAALALAGLAAPRPAAAQQNAATQQGAYFTTGASTINYAINGGAFVGEDTSGNTANPNTGQPYSPSVTLAPGGSVGASVEVFNSSAYSMTGGSVTGNVLANDTSTFSITGGTIGAAFVVSEAAGGTVSGGTIGDQIVAAGSGTVTINGGTITQGLIVGGSATVTVNGGMFGAGGGQANFQDFTTGLLTLDGTGLFETYTGTNSSGDALFTLGGLLRDGTSVAGDTLALGKGANFSFDNTPAAAPEPSPFAAFAIGLLGLSALAVTKRRAAR